MQRIRTFPSKTAMTARSGRRVDWICGNGDSQVSSVNCSAIPLSRIPSMTKSDSLALTCSSSPFFTIPSIYTRLTRVLVRTPRLIFSTFRSVDCRRLRRRAVLILTFSLNPSLEPRRTFSESVSRTVAPG